MEEEEAANLVVVLDMNGVVADVRRREECTVRKRQPDLVLHNGQRVYIHPQAAKFLGWLSLNRPGVKVVTYTSRKRHNAEPVERVLTDLVAQVGCIYKPHARLYGEDCLPGPTFHPIKSLRAVLSACPPGTRAGDVVFVDDNVHRIAMDCGRARLIRAESYDAMYETETARRLDDVVVALRQEFIRKNIRA